MTPHPHNVGDLSWRADAACRGMDLELFFGPDGERAHERHTREQQAKEICAQCPVRRACREHALTLPERAGVWGAMSEDERAAERRRRARRTTPSPARVA